MPTPDDGIDMKVLVHPVVATLQQAKADPDYDETKWLTHINEQSVLSLKLSLLACGFKSRAWLENTANPWASRRDLIGRVFSTLFKALGLKFSLGADMYAVASPK